MEISIIITTKNEQENIKKLLASLKAQKAKNFETIVVDNFSKDQTAKIAKQFKCTFVVHGNERSSQRNFGAKIAKGVWLIFLDADMQLKPDFVKNTLQFLKIQPKNTIFAIKEKSVGKNFWSKSIALEKNSYQDVSPLTAARIYRKNDFVKFGAYNPSMYAGEDWDLTQRFLKKNFKLKLVPQSIIHNENAAGLQNILKKDLYYIKNLAKHNQFREQGSLNLRLKLWFRSRKNLTKYPHYTLGFLFYKFIVFLIWKLTKKS